MEDQQRYQALPLPPVLAFEDLPVLQEDQGGEGPELGAALHLGGLCTYHVFFSLVFSSFMI